ncbi:hypothetical protein [Roseateles sp.]|uniref:hypothetical protein n=1 Tax=Roseateles sp. TaxID=1971397 RepID=UPI00286B3925|nr:hypothetical protein [Roseateles sp.]
MKIGAKRIWCSRPVLQPPPFGPFDLTGSSKRDTQPARHGLTQTVQSSKKLLSGNCFPAVRFFDRFDQLRFLFQSKLNRVFRLTRQHDKRFAVREI